MSHLHFFLRGANKGGRAGEGFRLELPVVVLFQESGRVVAAARTLEEVQTLPKYTSRILLSNALKTKEIKEKRNVLIFFLSHIFYTFFTTVKGKESVVLLVWGVTISILLL